MLYMEEAITITAKFTALILVINLKTPRMQSKECLTHVLLKHFMTMKNQVLTCY